MNKQESDILLSLLAEPFINQRILAESTGHSLGVVNRSLKQLIEKGYLDEQMRLTKYALSGFKKKAPKNAIILAAGFGMRMVPINMQSPKALVEVNGEVMIERIIRQLHEVGIDEIYIVVGFLKEQFEYLIDEYGVKLIINDQYALKNNSYSLSLVLDHLSNSYIIPSDVWCDNNPFSRYELYSWYMVSDLVENESTVRVNRKMELVSIPEGMGGNAMIGMSYLVEDEAKVVREKIKAFVQDEKNDHQFWEEALFDHHRMICKARVVHASDVVEINTYEQLRELDSHSNQLKSEAISTICRALQIESDDIENIEVLKKGMTNRSFLFQAKGQKYIMRIPGEGTDKLINRQQEAAVYSAISGKGLCDDPVYINPENGYKITKFINHVRCCDASDINDLKICMKKLKAFHSMKLKVDHEFDIFKQIEFYESLWDGKPSIFKDYKKTKKNVYQLKDFVEKTKEESVLTHIDAVPDNFLFGENEAGHIELQLTDWEYAGMQDPHVDIAMFSIYAMYDKKQIDQLIDIYFDHACSLQVRIKIYAYIAMCGLLWSNWCEYKRNLGVEFGEYSLRQYRYAKEYYRYATAGINKEDMG